MPGTVSLTEAKGAPVQPADVDFTMALIGYTSKNPVTAGLLGALYGSPSAAATDYGLGDCVDAACQALTKSNDNPQPPALAIYSTPGTTAGSRGSTLTTTGVTGTSVVTKTASTHPIGTYQPVGRVLNGCTIGVTGGVIQFSPDGGRTWLAPQQLGTATTLKMQIGGLDTGVQYDFAAGTLITGDTWSESETTPTMWGDSDLYSAGPPATGAFAAIGARPEIGMIVITDPVASGDFSTIVAGLDYIFTTYGRRMPTIIRFRNPTASETDAQYITAFKAFAALCQDDRVTAVAGSGWLTDAFRGMVWFRSGLPAVLARLQGSSVIPGQVGERIAQHPGFVGRGPLENFTIVDPATGNLIPGAHDEAAAGGIDGPTTAGTGGGLTFYYNRFSGVQGTYVSKAPVLYPPLNTVLTLMDRRVDSAIERVAGAVVWTMIQGAAIIDPGTNVLDDDLRSAMASRISAAIAAALPNEFANATDPNLVQIDPAVSISGADATITGQIGDRLFVYTNKVGLTLTNTR